MPHSSVPITRVLCQCGTKEGVGGWECSDVGGRKIEIADNEAADVFKWSVRTIGWFVEWDLLFLVCRLPPLFSSRLS